MAKFKVLRLSLKEHCAGDIVAIMVVLQLPPKESSKSRVNLLSRYGICFLSFVSVKAFITLPKALKDLFIFMLSCNCFPVAPVIRVLSLPAKSTKFNLPIFVICFPVLLINCSTVIINTAWERDETSFMKVLLTSRHVAPRSSKAYISEGFLTAHSDKPSTYKPFFLSSLIDKFLLLFSGFNKSLIISLYICK